MSFESEVIEAEFRTVSSSKTLKEIESISNAIIKLKRETQDLERQKKEAAVQFGANSKQVKDLTERIRANNAQLALQRSRLEETNRSLKLNEMSTKQLRQRQAELKKALEAVNKEAFPDRWNRLNRALQETTGQLNRTTNGSNAVRKGLGSVMSYAKSLLPAFGFSAIAGGVLSLGKELFELSIQMKSDSIRNTTIFGDSLKYVETQAAQLSKAMGVTNREFVSNAASSADLLKPLGFTSDEAAKLSVKIQELAGPLAEWSKGKYDATQITEVMNGALTGEMERLKGLGIIIQQSSPEYLNLVKAKQKEENCTLDQAKALATLELMYQKSTDAQLAFQAGGNELSRNWENLKATWRRAKEWMVELFDETAADQLEKQQNHVNGLAAALTNTNTSSAERVRILNQLKSISPDIVEGLNAENLEMGKLRENLDRYNGSMLERITMEKLNADTDKKRDKLASANVDLGIIGGDLHKYMAKANPEIAMEDISLEKKMAKIEELWRNSGTFNREEKGKYSIPVKIYKDYQKQKEEVEELQAELDESVKEMEIKKSMMLFPSSDTGTTPVSRLLPKGSDAKKSGKDSPRFTDDETKNQKSAFSKSSSVEQENENYKKLLTDAGLFGKKRADLTGESLRALDAIEKTHRDNIAKLDQEAITKFLDEKKVAADRELSDLRIKQNTELSSIENLEDAKRVLSKTMSADELNNIQTMEQAKKALSDKNNKEEREVTKRQAEDINRIISDIQNKKDVKGLKLADNIISEDENKLLQDRMQQAQDTLAKMSAGEAQFLVELVAAREKAYADATNAAMTATEQENQAYNERLTACGLFAKTKEELTGEALKTFEALEKAHQKKLNEIDKNAIANFVTKKQTAYQQELNAQKAKQDEEYASIKTFRQAKERLSQTMSASELGEINSLADARKALQSEHAKETRQTVARQTSELLGILQTLSDGKNIPDLKLSDHILSEEENQELQDRIAKAKAALARILKEDVDAETGETKASGVDLLGMSPERWQSLFENLATGKIGIEDMQLAAEAMMQAWGMANNLMTAKENQALKAYEDNTKKKKDALNKQLDAGEISQEQYNARTAQMDAELDAKKEEIQQKQAKREKAMAITSVITNTALAIMKIWAEVPKLDFGASTIALTAIAAAMGVAQLATIMAQPDGFKKGGFTSSGASDDQEAGIVHANEFVATADAVRNPTVLPVLQMIDKAQRDGTVSTLDLSESARQRGFRSGGFTSPVPESTTSGTQSDTTSADPELKQLLRKNIAAIDRLYAEGVAAHFTYAEHKRMTKSIQTYEQKTTTPR